MALPRLSAIRMTPNEGKPLLVLGPSLGTSAVLWDGASELLRPHFSIIKWDLPGHGISRPTREPFTVAELAQAVIALADELDGAEFFYAGVSLGGAVGLELALSFPHRLKALALICSAARFGQSADWLQRAEQVRSQGTSSMVSGSALRWFGPDFIATSPAVASALLHALSAADDESYALCCEALARFDRHDRLSEISQPMLAVSGEYDQTTPTDEMVSIARGTQAGTAIEVRGAGHLAPAEQPQKVAELLIDFFTQGVER